MSKEKYTHYQLDITEKFGDYECSYTPIVAISPSMTQNEQLHDYTRDFRCSGRGDWSEDMGGYWFDGNIVKLASVRRKLTQSDVDLFNNLFG